MELLPHVPDIGESVLDIGFGKGQIPYYFKNQNKIVTSIGLELESYGTDINKARSDGISVIEANVLNMPFEDNSFDTVVASHILEHISDMGTALAEIRRVLARGAVRHVCSAIYSYSMRRSCKYGMESRAAYLCVIVKWV